MARGNPNKPSTLPAPAVDWKAVRRDHGKPDQTTAKRHERDIARLDRVPEEKGGSGTE
jgi:hypothetical protein